MPTRILIVEDEEDLVEILMFNLQKEGFVVQSETDGAKALKRAAQWMPDLILLDLMLPGLNGIHICRFLKGNIATKEIPIMMLTAKSEESDIIKGLGAGADDYLTKPFSINVLMARIHAILRRTQKMADGVIQIGELMLNPESFECHLHQNKKSLTKAEFKALYLLAGHPGKIFTRDHMINSVHGETHMVTHRTIDVLMVGLRKKLGNAADLIETVRGVGYRFKT